MERQGKSKRNYRTSAKLTFYAYAGLIATAIAIIIFG